MGGPLAGRLPAYLVGILGVFALGMVLAAALLWLPAADPALAQDGAGPEITADPLITSNPESGDAYDKGEAIQVAVTFNEPVTVTGKPRLRLTVGEKRRWAKYDRSEEDGARLIFTYKVKAADQDDDGVSIKKNSIDLNGGAIEDADGNRARLRHGKVTHQAGHKVNGSPPESEPEPTPTPQPEPTPTPTPEPTPTPQPTPTPTPTPEPTPTPQPTPTPTPTPEPTPTPQPEPTPTPQPEPSPTPTPEPTPTPQPEPSPTPTPEPTPTPTPEPTPTPSPTPTPEPTPTPQPTPANPPPANNEPQFAGETADRSVAENSPAGTSVGGPVIATDGDDDDALTYALTGSNDFTIDNAGRITVAPGATLDYESQASYSVTVTVHDGKATDGTADTSVDDSIEVAITITNVVDEPGKVVLNTNAPRMGSAVTASVSDPEDGVLHTYWRWYRSRDGSIWGASIDGARDSIYIPSSNDVGYYLRALVAYIDRSGDGHTIWTETAYPVEVARTAEPTPTPEPTPEPTPTPMPAANNEPEFAVESTARSVAENTRTGRAVGAPVTATDGDADTLTYALTGSDDFTVDDSGRIMVASGASLDYETQAEYTVTVTVHDGKATDGTPDASVDDTIEVTITVLNVDEAGVVALDTDVPQTSSTMMASLSDPDSGVSGVSWAWESSADGMTWTAIAGVSSAAYTPSDADSGKYLRATAYYADGHGPGKSAQTAMAYKVDDVPPRVISVDIVSTPRNGDTYREGEHIIIGATFSEPVEPHGEDIAIHLTIGSEKKVTIYHSHEGCSTELMCAIWYFSHQVHFADMDADGVSVEKDQLLGATLLVGAAGVPAILEHSALPDQADHKVDGRAVGDGGVPASLGQSAAPDQVDGGAPRITSVEITSTPANDDTYGKGEEIEVTVTLSEPVTPLNTIGSILNGLRCLPAEIDVRRRPILSVVVNIGIPRARHFYLEEATENTWIFRSTVGLEEMSNGISIPANSVRLPPGVTNMIEDADGNIVNLDHPALPADPAHQVYTLVRGRWDYNWPAKYDIDRRNRYISENTPPGEKVGGPLTARDDNIRGEPSMTYTLVGRDAGAFDLDSSTGQILVKDALDYETKSRYEVSVAVDDGVINRKRRHDGGLRDDAWSRGADDSIDVFIFVGNVDEAGTVALNAETPQVGSAVTASVTDPDGSVTGVIWAWERSTDGTMWAAIAGASSAAYTPVDDDEGKYLRATASYADGEGSGKSAQAVTLSVVIP